jgi:flavin reductase (DIM6/NTAB) family NADH-FMN oxidoreductase RutF
MTETAISDTSEITPQLFRKAMGRFATGVTVITTEQGGEARGMTASAFMSGSLAPPLCVISIAKTARMHALLLDTGKFGVSMLSRDQEAVSKHFAGRPIEGLEIKWEHHAGVPVLAGACGTIAAKVVAQHDCGDHTLFVGHILDLRAHDKVALAYHAGHYATLMYQKDDSPVPKFEFW